MNGDNGLNGIYSVNGINGKHSVNGVIVIAFMAIIATMAYSLMA